MYLYIGIIFLICIVCSLFCFLRRKHAAKKVCDMTCEQKCSLIENLLFPFGYTYIKSQDIFSSSLDAWQKRFGYTAFYDHSASHFHMVFDALPVYFDYAGHTWLIEFWKGQYGINAGCEIGIYRSEHLLSKEEYSSELFHAVEEEEMLPLSFQLSHNHLLLAGLNKVHWWLTAFCTGHFANPKDLEMDISITFPNACMASAFTVALEAMGYDVSVCGLKVCFTFHRCHTCHHSCLARLYRRWIQWQNRLLCRFFLWFTRPFTCNLDRVLFLFEYLPPVFHRVFQIHRSSRKVRKQL
ncbi:MAG: DUF4474 domain-containing protein [Lachnospiraceae bacterium]|nr:DUF4474 domain-containing protein [Lachnospiraceae bacterium]